MTPETPRTRELPKTRDGEAPSPRGGARNDRGAAPVCRAPSSVLVLDGDGRVYACEAARQPLVRRKADDLRRVWRGRRRRALAAAVARGECPADHCAVCLDFVQSGTPEAAPSERDHAAEREGDAQGPSRLLVRVERRTAPLDVEATIARIRSVLDHLQVLELDVDDVATCTLLEPVAELLRDLPVERRPALRLRIGRVSAPQAAYAALAGLPVDAVVVRASARTLQAVVWAKRVARGKGSVVVRYVLDGDNWFDLVRLAPRCAAAGVALELRVAEPDGHVPSAVLPADQRRVCAGQLGSFWEVLGGPDRPASIADGAFQGFVREARRLLVDDLRRHLHVGAQEAIAGRGAGIRLPDASHPMLAEPHFAGRILHWLLGLRAFPSLVEWAQRLLEEHAAAVAERPWLRILACRAAFLEPSPALFDALLRVYPPDDAPRLLDAERAFAEQWRVAQPVADLHAWLGFDRLGERRAPFVVPDAPPEPPAGEADVTILVPSYGHEAYVREALLSALTQSHGAIRVHVFDDRSPDATVERARSVADARLTISVNERNLGLADSLLAALEQVETPFVAILNSDDLLHPERIARCREVLLADPSATLVATDLFLVDGAGLEITPDNTSRLRDGPLVHEWVHWYERARPGDPADCFGALLEANFLATSTNIVCRTDFLRREAPALRSLKYCLDWHLFLIAALEGGLRYLPEKLAAYRLHRSNTVWFRAASRWSYHLEVNRVAATACERFLRTRLGAAASPDDAAVSATLRTLAEHLTRNSEVHGLALFASQLFGGEAFDRVAHAREDAGAAVAELSRTADAARRLRYAARDLGDERVRRALSEAPRLPTLEVGEQLAAAAIDDLEDTRRGEVWARREIGRLRDELSELTAWRNRVVAALAQVVRRMPGARMANGPPEALVAADWTAMLAAVTRELDTLTTARQQLERDLDAVRRQHERQHERQQRAEKELLDVLAVLRKEVAALRDEKTALEREQRTVRTELAQQRSLLRDTEQRRARLAARVDSAEAARRKSEAELQRVLGSPEWRIGHLVWRKTPFFAKSRRLSRAAYRTARDASSRTMANVRRWFGRTRQPVRIAAVSTGRFPILSHTFVYQELTALHEMFGAELRLFHRAEDETAPRHAAFAYLDRNRCVVASDWSQHKADYEHYKATRPERVERLMQALSQASGTPREKLEADFEVMYAFTFARRVEAWNADYVHSYFFYEAALQALVASELLDLPRGASAYADHMMQDWGLKVVPLHLRTAQLVVATSNRIREELITLGGPDVADKILVKPNGVDGSRFPYVARPPVAGRPIELVVVSRIEPKKGMHELVDVARILRERGVAFRVHVVGAADPGCKGSEEYAAEFHRRIDEHGVRSHFVLHGALVQEGIRPLLERADAFVAPFVETERGDKDGIPTAVLEAMSSGLPVVASDAGSITEVVVDGVEGYVVPQRDAPAFAGAIQRLLEDPQRAPTMGRAARRRFERHFDVRATEPLLHERLRAVLATERQRRENVVRR